MQKDVSVELKKISVTSDSSLIIPFFEGNIVLSSSAKKADELSGGALHSILKHFKAEKGEQRLIMPAGKLQSVLLMGLGKKEQMRYDILIDCFADAAKTMRGAGCKEVNILLDDLDAPKKISAATIGCLVGLHRFLTYKTKGLEKLKHLEKVVLMTNSDQKSELAEALIVADAMRKTRDMVNSPPNISTTESLAEYARKVALGNKLKFTLLDDKKLLQLKMGCIHAVGKGAQSKPQMVIVEYTGNGKEKPLLLVGKGITFDSGGYNLKPSNYISNMKDDKAGALTVLHVIEAIAKLKLKINVVAVMAIAENLVSGEAFRPDDILTAYNGMTVEITNTDAEGRLVLADAMSYATQQFKPKGIVDIATLTGASLYALGTFTTPIVANNDDHAALLKAAATEAGERVWQLPSWEEYFDALKSDVADMKNATDGPDAGVIIGALFIKQFVGDYPWVHMDIGTTVWSKMDRGVKQKGATGVGVRTLIELAKQWK